MGILQRLGSLLGHSSYRSRIICYVPAQAASGVMIWRPVARCIRIRAVGGPIVNDFPFDEAA